MNPEFRIQKSEVGSQKGKLETGDWKLWAVACFLLSAFCLLSFGSAPAVVAAANLLYPQGAVTDTPTITIAGATADTTTTPTSTAREAQIQWKFGTVAGSFTTCTVQAKTSYDGVNYLTLGSAASVTVTTGTVNAWTILEQAPTTSVTTSSVSSTAALGFGLLTKYTFACSGSYGTSAPVTVSVIYR